MHSSSVLLLVISSAFCYETWSPYFKGRASSIADQTPSISSSRTSITGQILNLKRSREIAYERLSMFNNPAVSYFGVQQLNSTFIPWCDYISKCQYGTTCQRFDCYSQSCCRSFSGLCCVVPAEEPKTLQQVSSDSPTDDAVYDPIYEAVGSQGKLFPRWVFAHRYIGFDSY